eukprot:Amastigsp_a842552_9.p1 type:complete len:768 gc:universal Amastigsp_a842552_9:2352-49(-)
MGDVVVAATAADALAAFAEHGPRVDVLFTDLSLGAQQASGFDLARQARELDADSARLRQAAVRIVAVTGWSRATVLSDPRASVIDAVVEKPYRAAAIDAALSSALRSTDAHAVAPSDAPASPMPRGSATQNAQAHAEPRYVAILVRPRALLVAAAEQWMSCKITDADLADRALNSGFVLSGLCGLAICLLVAHRTFEYVVCGALLGLAICVFASPLSAPWVAYARYVSVSLVVLAGLVVPLVANPLGVLSLFRSPGTVTVAILAMFVSSKLARAMLAFSGLSMAWQWMHTPASALSDAAMDNAPLGLAVVSDVVAGALLVEILAHLCKTTEELMYKVRAEHAVALASSSAQMRFLGAATHELRTPLLGICGLLDELRGGASMSVHFAAKQLAVLSHSAKSLEETLLAVLAITAQSFAPSSDPFASARFAPVALADVIRRVVQLFSSSARYFKIELDLQWAPELPRSLVVCTDAELLAKALGNLVSNALKYSHGIGRQILVRCERDDERPLDDGHIAVCIRVRDFGPGIPARALDRLFEPMTENLTASALAGSALAGPALAARSTGLGLSNTRAFMSALGGSVTVTSSTAPGESFSEFVLRLQPKVLNVNVAEAAHASGATPAQNARTEAGKANGHLTVERAVQRTLNVLIVDDSALTRRLVCAMLKSLGHSSTHAVDGLDALTKLDKESFDCVLMDLQMPRFDGFETIARIRARERVAESPRLPVVACSASGDDDKGRERALSAGFDEMLGKPYRLEALEAVLRELV